MKKYVLNPGEKGIDALHVRDLTSPAAYTTGSVCAVFESIVSAE